MKLLKRKPKTITYANRTIELKPHIILHELNWLYNEIKRLRKENRYGTTTR